MKRIIIVFLLVIIIPFFSCKLKNESEDKPVDGSEEIQILPRGVVLSK